MTPADHIDARSLAYLARQRSDAQGLPLLKALIAEIFASAGDADGCSFMRHVGRRMAGDLGAPSARTLEALEQAINARWAEMDWGWVSLITDGRSLTLTHGAYPGAGTEASHWQAAMAALLEGLYEAWLAVLGEGATLRVSCTEQHDMALVFRCHGA